MSDNKKNEMRSGCVLVLSVVGRDSGSGARNSVGECVLALNSAPLSAALVHLHHETRDDIAIVPITPSSTESAPRKTGFMRPLLVPPATCMFIMELFSLAHPQ